MTQFIPSPEQQAIFDAVLKTSDNIAIAALAGAGKTTSLVELSRRLPAGGSRIFCAFNKDIVKELESRLNGTGVTARTFHSIGLGALKKHLNVQELPPQADKYKVLVTEWATDNGVFELALSDAVQHFKPEERAEKLYELRKATLAMFVSLLNFVRLKLVAWDDINALDDLVAENALDADMEYDGHNDAIMELVLSSVDKLMKKAEAQTRKLIIDYTDMIYWAVKWNARFFQYQWVLVDECQDLSPLQREMIAKIVSPRGGRIVLVGDPNQAIYAFAGADSNSFSLSVERWNCKVLPLTMTRRCDSIITQHASLLVPSFRCPDDKARGKVVWLPEETLHKHARIGDMVLSRVKAPLVKSCLSLIAEGIPATILGADIGKQLVAMLEKVTKRSGYTFPRLLDEIIAYRDEQIEAAMLKEDEARAEAIRDTFDALKFVIESYPNATDIKMLEDKILGLFADDKPSDSVVTLATVHKSKGLEAKRVFILAPDKLPLRAKNMTSEQYQQEVNLDYVARTRAKNELVYMTNEKFLKNAVMPDYVQEDFEEWNADKPTLIEAEPVIEAELVDDTVPAYPSFATYFQEIISLMGTTNVLYATSNGVKLCVSRIALGVTALNIATLSADEESTHIAEMPETIDLMQAFEPNLNHWMSVSVAEWDAIRNPAPVVDAVFKTDGMFIEAFSTPDDVPVTFTVQITELLASLSPNSGLFAVDEDVKMFVAPHIMEKGKFFVETVNGTYTQEVMTLDEAIAKMEAFSPVVPTWNELTCDHWMHATSTQKTVAERRADKLAETSVTPVPVPDAPQPESAGFINTITHKALELLTQNDGMYATANHVKMFVTPFEGRYVVKTIFVNGDENNPVDTIQEALALMFEFQPNPNQWEVISLAEWAEKRNPTPVVEASEPPAFAKTMHQRLTDLNANYDPDKGLFADGEKTTMYITTDIEDNFVVYERDYANEPEMAWSRDYKTTNIVTLISKMQAINPDATQWTMTAWGEWIDRFHEEDEPANPTVDEAVNALRAVVTEMGGVITDTPQPETPTADALTVSIIAKTLINDQFTQQQADELASQIHAEVKPLLTFTDWTPANIATIKVVVKRLLRQFNHLGYTEAIANAIAHFYQHGTLPLNPVLGQISEYQAWRQEQTLSKAEETGAVVDALLNPSFADVMIPRIQALTPADPSSAIGLASYEQNSSFFVFIGADEMLVMEIIHHNTGQHFTTPANLDTVLDRMVRHTFYPDEWVSMSWNDWYKSAHSEPTDTPIEAPQPVADVVTTPVTPPADDSTFSNGESTPPYTNGKDNSASTTPTPAPLPSTAPDVLKSLIDQFRPLELTEITLMIQALEHVRKEKTEGATV